MSETEKLVKCINRLLFDGNWTDFILSLENNGFDTSEEFGAYYQIVGKYRKLAIAGGK